MESAAATQVEGTKLSSPRAIRKSQEQQEAFVTDLWDNIVKEGYHNITRWGAHEEEEEGPRRLDIEQESLWYNTKRLFGATGNGASTIPLAIHVLAQHTTSSSLEERIGSVYLSKFS